MNNTSTRTALFLLLAVSIPTQAGTWQVGTVAESSRSPFVGNRQETHILPFVDYVGDRVRYVGGKLSYALDALDGRDLYLVGQVRPRQTYSASLDSGEDLGIEGLQDREPAIELGMGFERQTSAGKFVLESLADASDTHGGFELTAEYTYPTRLGTWLLEPGIGVQVQSRKLVDYYHGVREAEARADRPAYEGRQAINTMATLVLAYPIDSRWLAVAGLEHLMLDAGIADSPIVAQDEVRKVYFGVVYSF